MPGTVNDGLRNEYVVILHFLLFQRQNLLVRGSGVNDGELVE
jgi:hypothetical protein